MDDDEAVERYKDRLNALEAEERKQAALAANAGKDCESIIAETASAIKNGSVKPSIILRGSKDMTYSDLSEFMKICAKADLRDFLPERSPIGITEVTFTTTEGNGK